MAGEEDAAGVAQGAPMAPNPQSCAPPTVLSLGVNVTRLLQMLGGGGNVMVPFLWLA